MPTASKHWRSLDDLAATPEFQELVRREFHGRPFEALPPASRRQFLKVMGASMALAGLAACRWPSEEIVPFAHRPEDRTPGVPQRFATALELGGAATGMVVTSLDGRPIKVDGNPGHPDSLGAASARHQAAVLELYDPDRSADPLERSGERRLTRTWADVEAAVGGRLDELAGSGGTGLAVLATSSSSPTLARLRRLWQERFPEATWYEHEPLSRDAERSGARLVFGRPLRRLMHLDAAEVVVALDDDPLLEHPAALRLAHDLAASRRLDQGAGHGRSGRSGHQMSRLYAAECTYSVTGAMADHRLGVPRAAIPAVLVEVIRLLETSHGIDLPEPAAALLREVRPLADGGRGAAFTRRLAADLASHRGRSAILVGPSQAPVVHALGHLLDLALGNHGTVVELVELVELSWAVQGNAASATMKTTTMPRDDAFRQIACARSIDISPMFAGISRPVALVLTPA